MFLSESSKNKLCKSMQVKLSLWPRWAVENEKKQVLNMYELEV
jgi:hypothetical protein